MVARAPRERALAAAARRLLGQRRLLIATNRGPVTFVGAPDGAVRARRGSGGLVTALSQLGRHVPVTWLAAALTEGDRRVAADPSLASGRPPPVRHGAMHRSTGRRKSCTV